MPAPDQFDGFRLTQSKTIKLIDSKVLEQHQVFPRTYAAPSGQY